MKISKNENFSTGAVTEAYLEVEQSTSVPSVPRPCLKCLSETVEKFRKIKISKKFGLRKN
jgi:hypothetical protein